MRGSGKQKSEASRGWSMRLEESSHLQSIKVPDEAASANTEDLVKTSHEGEYINKRFTMQREQFCIGR